MKFSRITKKYPIVRGMVSYTMIWPVASLIQQKISGKEQLDYMQAMRFSLYGGFFVAPSLYCWLKCASHFWPKTDLKSAITKVRHFYKHLVINNVLVNYCFKSYCNRL
jgi:protein Mpv17